MNTKEIHWIEKQRKVLKLSRTKLGKILGMSGSTIEKIEQGLRYGSDATLTKITDFLDKKLPRIASLKELEYAAEKANLKEDDLIKVYYIKVEEYIKFFDYCIDPENDHYRNEHNYLTLPLSEVKKIFRIQEEKYYDDHILQQREELGLNDVSGAMAKQGTEVGYLDKNGIFHQTGSVEIETDYDELIKRLKMKLDQGELQRK